MARSSFGANGLDFEALLLRIHPAASREAGRTHGFPRFYAGGVNFTLTFRQPSIGFLNGQRSPVADIHLPQNATFSAVLRDPERNPMKT
jgi:hypothetical protein